MSKFVKFVDAESGATVFINPAAIRLIDPGPDGGTHIRFDKNHAVFVRETAETVATAMSS